MILLNNQKKNILSLQALYGASGIKILMVSLIQRAPNSLVRINKITMLARTTLTATIAGVKSPSMSCVDCCNWAPNTDKGEIF
jgi:hypothetical protein